MTEKEVKSYHEVIREEQAKRKKFKDEYFKEHVNGKPLTPEQRWIHVYKPPPSGWPKRKQLRVAVCATGYYRTFRDPAVMDNWATNLLRDDDEVRTDLFLFGRLGKSYVARGHLDQ